MWKIYDFARERLQKQQMRFGSSRQYCSGTISVLFQYFSSTVPVLHQYYSNTVSVLLQYCSSTAPVMLQYCFSAVPILLLYCISAAPVLFHFVLHRYCSSHVAVLHHCSTTPGAALVLLQHCSSSGFEQDFSSVRILAFPYQLLKSQPIDFQNYCREVATWRKHITRHTSF